LAEPSFVLLAFYLALTFSKCVLLCITFWYLRVFIHVQNLSLIIDAARACTENIFWCSGDETLIHKWCLSEKYLRNKL